MTRSVLAIAIATILTGVTAFAQQPAAVPESAPKSATATTATNSTTVKKAAVAKPAAPNKADQQFLKDFTQANAAEVEVGKLALQKAQRTEVKTFAKHMVDDHSKTLEKAQAIAGKTKVEVTGTPDPTQKEVAASLDKTSPIAFDQAYMKSMVDAHEKAVVLLEKEIKSGRNADVKKLASETLPDVKKHLKTASDLHELLEAMSQKSASDR